MDVPEKPLQTVGDLLAYLHGAVADEHNGVTADTVLVAHDGRVGLRGTTYQHHDETQRLLLD
jgi:hypothetical protein